MIPIQINKTNVHTNYVMFESAYCDRQTAICKALALETLRARMIRGEIVRFAFMKKDGSIRYAVGTLQIDTVKANTNGRGVNKQGIFAYIDMQKMEWRSFCIENFIGLVA